ncbi:MAG TPA: hypothetical protein VF774_23710, partial [Pseudoduganella sp.]
MNTPIASSSLPPRRAMTALRGVAAVLAALACTAATAATYTMTTSTQGSTANFQLPNFFPQGNIDGIHTYELSVTSVFDSANVLASTDNAWMHATDAALEVVLRVDSQVYRMETTGMVSSQVLVDTDGNGKTTKRFYQNVSFDPATYGDHATVQQYVFLDSDQFPITSVLAPATAYYADPLTIGFSIYNWNVAADGSLTRLGDAV